MSYTTTEARDEIREKQAVCGMNGVSYTDYVWSQRYPNLQRTSSGAWPFKPASQQASNVTRLPFRPRDCDGVWMP